MGLVLCGVVCGGPVFGGFVGVCVCVFVGLFVFVVLVVFVGLVWLGFLVFVWVCGVGVWVGGLWVLGWGFVC
ncbi:hypothetical protein, partial [Vibrio parahaemolyticus]|uniref:hypothetical protein n=1 Tax=Vibrio parahaemolyticus TaxID=670 RepID=UPI002112B925